MEDRRQGGCMTEFLDHPLLIAIVANRKDVVEFLIDNGADLSQAIKIYGYGNKINYCMPFLVVAYQMGCADVAELLIDKGSDVNAIATSFKFKYRVVDERGTSYLESTQTQDMTTLQIAINACIKYGDIPFSLVELLLSRGADPNAKGARDLIEYKNARAVVGADNGEEGGGIGNGLVYEYSNTPLDMALSGQKFPLWQPPHNNKSIRNLFVCDVRNREEFLREAKVRAQAVNLLLVNGADFDHYLKTLDRVLEPNLCMTIERWSTCMAIIVLQELGTFHHLEQSTIIQLRQFLYASNPHDENKDNDGMNLES